jgi:hypothetical protein
MGQIEESERTNLIVDKDTQMVYDVRREIDLARLDRQTSVSSMGSASNDTSLRLGSEASSTAAPR